MANDDEPTVPIVCENCNTRTDVSLTEAAGAIERHNDRLHDGERIAQVDPEIAKHVTDLVAEDMELLD